MRSTIPFLLLLALVLLQPLSARADPVLSDWVFGSGGNRVSNGVHIVECTFGQPAIGLVADPVFIHEMGFWHQWVATFVAIQDPAGQPTIKFWLNQNYPNPFNPITTLEFSVPEHSHVTITLFDANGRQLRRLVDRACEPGIHTTAIIATDLPSGAYYCRMQAGAFVHTRKLVLLK